MKHAYLIFFAFCFLSCQQPTDRQPIASDLVGSYEKIDGYTSDGLPFYWLSLDLHANGTGLIQELSREGTISKHPSWGVNWHVSNGHVWLYISNNYREVWTGKNPEILAVESNGSMFTGIKYWTRLK